MLPTPVRSWLPLSLVLLAASSFLAVGCGDDDTTSTSSSGDGGTAGSTSSGGDAATGSTTSSSGSTTSSSGSTTSSSGSTTSSSGSTTSSSGSTTSSSGSTDSGAGFTVGGQVSGLGTSTGLVLQLNGANNLAIATDGGFNFPTPLVTGAGYTVTVSGQPVGKTCSVAQDSGTIAGANVSTVAVTCAAGLHTIGGTITGLAAGASVTLSNNGGGPVTLTNSGPFAFAQGVPTGTAYAVTVTTQPAAPAQVCTATSATGTVGAADITDVAITCVTKKFKVSGTLSGITVGGTVVLQNNSADDLSLTANGAFSFVTSVDSGAAYAVTVLTQPTGVGQSCTVTAGTGNVTTADVGGVVVACSTATFTIGGTLSGLNPGGSVVLRNNGGDNLTVNANGAFTFAAHQNTGTNYNVTVLTQPNGQTCTVTGGTGAVAAANITSPAVSCVAAYGSGADGAATVAAGADINSGSLGSSTDANGPTNPDGIAFKVTSAPSAKTITVTGNAAGPIVVGDKVLLINMQSLAGDIAPNGLFEILDVAAVAGSTITTVQTISNNYAGTSFANQTVIVQRVPQYTNLSLVGGSLTAGAWDGLATTPLRTGIVAFFANGTLSLTGGTIDVTGLGFRGGLVGIGAPEDARSASILSGGVAGGNGASNTGLANGGAGGGTGVGGRGGNAGFAGGTGGKGGGGGSASSDTCCYGNNASGGGGGAPFVSGGNYAVGTTRMTLGGGAAAGGGGGSGGVALNYAPTFTTMGGLPDGNGGNAGKNYSIGGKGSAGGNGGGIVFVVANTVTGFSDIFARGAKGGSGGGGGGGSGWDGTAGGGGGAGADGAAGGTIYRKFGTSTYVGTISATGGNGGGGGGGGAGDGGGSGGGGGGGVGGGGGGGGTRSGQGVPVASASNGGNGGLVGACGGNVTAPATDTAFGLGGSPNGGGGSVAYGGSVCGAAARASNQGGIGTSGADGVDGSPTVNNGAGGRAGDTASSWGGGGGGGQSGAQGASGVLIVAP